MSKTAPLSCLVAACSLLWISNVTGFAQSRSRGAAGSAEISREVMLAIVRAEDERRWDEVLANLLLDRRAAIRKRAALGAGRIGDEKSVPNLIELLAKDSDMDVRAMSAFALGEIESPAAADGLIDALRETAPVRARAIEALGKIAAALPKEQEARQLELGKRILEELSHEQRRRAAPNPATVLFGLTAVLRSKAANAGPVVTEFLSYRDARIRADAGNTLARLRLKDGNGKLRELLVSDPDPIVRANAARVLGATEDKASFRQLLDRAISDRDSRVRVSAIRGLALLKEPSAVEALIRRAGSLTAGTFEARGEDAGEALEIATTAGRLLQGRDHVAARVWLSVARTRFGSAAPEVEIALVRVSPAAYLAELGTDKTARENVQRPLLLNWRAGSALAQGLGEVAALPETTKDKKALADKAEELLRAMLDYRNSGLTINTLVAVHSEYAIPDVLRAFAAFKPKDLDNVLRKHLKDSDVIIRGTAADLLGELPPDESNTRALTEALPRGLAEKALNDAALSILDALAKQKNAKANEAIKLGLDSSDHLVRRRAVALLKANGLGDFSSRIGMVQTKNTPEDYRRAISRIGKSVTAVVTTSRGSFTIEFLPNDSPLNVDNFIQLANKGYFNRIVWHRVVPNFVIQDGDPRGDGNGGPGYSIRCEINLEPYGRGAVGMALSGKDTGGSQWFVTHSRQPHLDGGYTVFGTVVNGMNIVDNIARGDAIISIVVDESGGRGPTRRR